MRGCRFTLVYVFLLVFYFVFNFKLKVHQFPPPFFLELQALLKSAVPSEKQIIFSKVLKEK